MVIVMTMTGKFGLSATYTGVFVYAAELFPTMLRNAGVGSSMTFGGLGTMIAPYFGTPVVR